MLEKGAVRHRQEQLPHPALSWELIHLDNSVHVYSSLPADCYWGFSAVTSRKVLIDPDVEIKDVVSACLSPQEPQQTAPPPS